MKSTTPTARRTITKTMVVAGLLTLALLGSCPAAQADGFTHSTATLSEAREGLAATSVGNYALFAGGLSNYCTCSNTVDIFDAATGQWSAASLSEARSGLVATSVGNYALFAGGVGDSGYSATVDIFNAVTGQWSTATLSKARLGMAATAAGNYALFAGGGPDVYSMSSAVDIYNASTGQWSTATLSEGRGYLAATSVGEFALFAGGCGLNGWSSTVDVFNAGTGQWSTATLSQGNCILTATTAGHYALFGGGQRNTVDIFDSSTGKWSTATLSQSRSYMAATSVGNYALFGGGSNGDYSNTVDVFDARTGQWFAVSLSQARDNLAATSVGGYALFAGGRDGGVESNTVDIFVPGPVSLPSVSITSPTSTYTTTMGIPLTFAATASTTSPGGSIASVDFYDGTTYCGAGVCDATNGIWTFAWDSTGASEGNHNFIAKATDNLGTQVFSSPATVVNIVVILPTVTIIAPTDSSTFAAGSTVTFVATASTANPDASIVSVIFCSEFGYPYTDWGTYDATSGTWTYAWTLQPSDAGNRGLCAIAVDNLGAFTYSPAVSFNITVTLPTVAITSPTSTYTAAMGSTVNLVATASTSAPGGSIASVQFYDDDALLGSGAYDAASGTWTYAWDTTGAPCRLHNITAEATDSMNIYASSSLATVIRVTNAVSVAITSPTSPYTTALGAVVNLVATASTATPGGSIASVRFYDSLTTSLGSGVYDAASDTWTYAWDTTGSTQGQHNITAVATDNSGVQAASSPATVVRIDVTQVIYPIVAITSPTGSNTALMGTTVNLIAAASTTVPDDSIASVQFNDSGSILGPGVYDAASNTWTYVWHTAGDYVGNHNIVAVATDNLGVEATSSPPTLVSLVAIRPTVAITSPTSTTTANLGSTINIIATASTTNPGGSIAFVQFYVDTTILAQGVYDAVGGTWTCAWGTGIAGSGLHSLTAVACDNLGNRATSSPATIVNLVGIPPTVAITSPTGTVTSPAGSMITFTATASTARPGGSITSVKFYEDGWEIGWYVGTGTAVGGGLYTAAWAIPNSTGPSRIQALATDDLDVSALSAPTVVNIITGPPTVTLVCTYTSTAWSLYALDQSPGSDGLAFVSVKIGNVLTAYNVSPETDSYLGDNSGGVAGTYGFSIAHMADSVGSGIFEIICGQNPGDLQNNTGYFLRHIGQQTVTYTATNDDGSTTRKTVAPAPMTLGGYTGYFVQIAQGELASGAVPTIVPYVGGNTASANVVNAGQTSTREAAAQALVIPCPSPSIALTAPTDGLIAGQGWLIALSATTTDNFSTVTGVEMFDGSTKLGDGLLAGGVWTYAWDTAAATFGTHRLTARMTDSGGLAATSNTVSVEFRVPGDGNGDGIVDGLDYGIWQNGYSRALNAAAGSFASFAATDFNSFSAGDYDGSGLVDATDYGVWQAYYNHTSLGSNSTVSADPDEVLAATATAPAASLISWGSAPRLIAITPASGSVASGVTSVALVFDSDVEASAGATEVSGLASGMHSNFVQAYDAATRTLTLTWATPLPADVYTVRVVADFVAGAGGGPSLDGETSNPAAATLPSGNGRPGGDARIEFTVE